nr:hypothetical protein [Bacteroidota bacterium]
MNHWSNQTRPDNYLDFIVDYLPRTAVCFEGSQKIQFSRNEFNQYKDAVAFSNECLKIMESGSFPSMIYKNTFNMDVTVQFCYDIELPGLHASGDNSGLDINCNTFNMVSPPACNGCVNVSIYDIFAGPLNNTSPAVVNLKVQGSSGTGAGNKFSPHPSSCLSVMHHLHIFDQDLTMTPWTYWDDPNNTQPPTANSAPPGFVLNINTSVTDNLCNEEY